MSTAERTRAWVDVSARAFQQNFLRIREAVGEGVRIIPMVKANAYGLGLAEAIQALEPHDPWGYGVAAVEEGVDIRESGVTKPILVLSPLPPGSYAAAVSADLSVSVSDFDGLARLKEAASAGGRPGGFHLEVDTGMGRAGFSWNRASDWGPRFRDLLGAPLRWDGCFTHFHSADGGNPLPTEIQWERLHDALGALPELPPGAIVHACNSPGSLRRPEFAADAVRPGIFLYGGVAGEGLPLPEPVASLRARVTFLREAEAGATVGYGSTYTAPTAERWATVGIGYGDGLPRLLSNVGSALVNGHRVPIIGRISMDMTVVDVSEVEGVEVGDVVTFFGRDGEEEILLEEVAGLARTINYEILTDLTPRVPRIWTAFGGY
jgi:alanine racemase